MKKVIGFIILISLAIFCYFYFKDSEDYLTKILKTVTEDEFNINKYSVFGTHFSINSCISKELDGDLNLVLKNEEEEIIVDSNFYKDGDKTCFNLSTNNNEGIYLDELKIGNFILLVKEENDSNVLYYTFSNETEYDNLEYYTITRNKKNNKINIIFDNKEKNYVEFKIKEAKLPSNVYDIAIDPGHGGYDPGTSSKLNGVTYYESDLTLDISLLLKEKLESLGLKVKLTREKDIALDNYGDYGRAVIPNEYKSKYSLSIHLNSAVGTMKYGGVEVYVPNDINYEFARMLASNISDIVGYSKKSTNKVESGIYFTYFTEKDVKESKEESIEKNLEPYDIKINAPYMYMIREIGGINTYAYVDGRNEEHGTNKYYNSNITAEPYLIELGYMNYKNDLVKIVNDKEKFAKEISKSIEEYLNIS